MKAKDRDELLVRLETILIELKKDFENHLAMHSKYTYLAISTVIGMLATLIVALLN